MNTRHYRRIAVALVRQSLVREAQFRTQLWVTMIIGVLEVGVALVPALLVFNRTAQVHGWRVGEVVAITGAAQLLAALLAAFVMPNQAKMTDYIRQGDLDQLLMRPVPLQSYAAVRWMQPAELWGAVAGLVLIVFGIAQAGLHPGPGDIAAALGWFVLGYVAVTLIMLNLGYLAFWITSATQVAELVTAVLSAGRYPLGFYPAAVRIGLLTIIPLGLATTVPIDALRGAGHLGSLPWGLGLVIILGLITRLHWVVGLRNYSSASS